MFLNTHIHQYIKGPRSRECMFSYKSITQIKFPNMQIGLYADFLQSQNDF
jgi:hypothetical protein